MVELHDNRYAGVGDARTYSPFITNSVRPNIVNRLWQDLSIENHLEYIKQQPLPKCVRDEEISSAWLRAFLDFSSRFLSYCRLQTTTGIAAAKVQHRSRKSACITRLLCARSQQKPITVCGGLSWFCDWAIRLFFDRCQRSSCHYHNTFNNFKC